MLAAQALSAPPACIDSMLHPTYILRMAEEDSQLPAEERRCTWLRQRQAMRILGTLIRLQLLRAGKAGIAGLERLLHLQPACRRISQALH